MSRTLRLAALAVAGLLGLLYASGRGWLGSHWGAGEVTRQPIPEDVASVPMGGEAVLSGPPRFAARARRVVSYAKR